MIGQDPTRPQRPSLELTLAEQANDAIKSGVDPHAATEMLGKMLKHLKENPEISAHGAEALANGVDPHAIAGRMWELTNGAPVLSGGIARQDKQFAALVGQGASLGFGAKILGGIDAANKMLPRALGGESAPASDFGKNYAATRDLIRGTAEQGIAEHPIAGRAVEALSGVATSLPALAGGAVAKAPLIVRSLRSAATGAGFGAAAGAGNATGGVSDYAKQIGTGAASGAVIGGGLPALGELGGKVGSRVLTTIGRPSGRSAEEIAADAAAMRAPQGPQAPSNTPSMDHALKEEPGAGSSTPRTTALQAFRASSGRVVQGAGIESAKTRALRLFADAAERDNVTPADAVAYANRAGNKPVAVLDLGEGNVAGLARTAKDVPSLARRQIPEFLKTRSAGSFGDEGATLQRVTQDIENHIGLKPENYYQTVGEMADQQKALSKPAYDKVRNVVVDDPEVLSLFDIPEFKFAHKAVASAERIRPNGAKIPPLSETVEVEGKTSKVQNPQTLGTLDKMRQYIGDVARGKIESKRIDRHIAGAMLDRLNAATARLDELHPDYAAARAGYSGRAGMMDAYQAGKDEFLTLDPREIQGKLATLPEGEADMYRRGSYDALRANKLTKMEDGANVGAFLEKNPDIRQRVATLAKDPNSVQPLRSDFNVERAMGDRKNFILGGPNTAERLIDHDAAESAIHIAKAVTSPTHAANAVVGGFLKRRAVGQTSAVMSEVGKIMTRTGSSGIQQTFDEIGRLNASDAEKRMLREAIAKAFAQAGPRANPQKQN